MSTHRDNRVVPLLGTRLHIMVHREDHWEIWTASNTRAGDSSTWLGTFFRLYPDGTVYQVTRREEGESDLQIR